MRPWRWRRAVLPAALLLLATAGCATVDPLEDLRMEAEIKARLAAQKDANLTRVGVVSRGATIHLTGTVESSEQRARAESLARDVRGVLRVENALEVRAPSR